MIHLLYISLSSAKDIPRAKLIAVTPDDSGVTLTLRPSAETKAKGSYFYVHLNRKDPRSFDTLARITASLHRRKDSLLNLTIDSFSETPSGSRYEDGRVRLREGDEP